MLYRTIIPIFLGAVMALGSGCGYSADEPNENATDVTDQSGEYDKNAKLKEVTIAVTGMT